MSPKWHTGSHWDLFRWRTCFSTFKTINHLVVLNASCEGRRGDPRGWVTHYPQAQGYPTPGQEHTRFPLSTPTPAVLQNFLLRVSDCDRLDSHSLTCSSSPVTSARWLTGPTGLTLMFWVAGNIRSPSRLEKLLSPRNPLIKAIIALTEKKRRNCVWHRLAWLLNQILPWQGDLQRSRAELFPVIPTDLEGSSLHILWFQLTE